MSTLSYAPPYEIHLPTPLKTYRCQHHVSSLKILARDLPIPGLLALSSDLPLLLPLPSRLYPAPCFRKLRINVRS